MRKLAASVCALLLVALVVPSPAMAVTVTQSWAVGNEPYGVTVDPRDGRVYVAINNSKNFSGPENMWVIDPTVPPPWNPPYGNMPVLISLPSPQVMSVLDPALDRLFVSLANGSLGIVDVRSRSLVTTVANAGFLGLALDRTTHVVYSALGYGGLAMTDGATGTVLHRAGAGSGDSYWAVAQDPSRHRVYATNLGSTPGLVAFDDRDLTEVGRIALPEIPRLALAVDQARGLVYVAGYTTATYTAAGHLYAIDASTLALTSTIDVGLGRTAAFSATLDTASDRLYLSNISSLGYAGGELVTVDLSTFSVADRVPLDFQPGQAAFHPDGHLYVAGFSNDALVELDMHNTAPVIDTVAIDPAAPRTNDTVRAIVGAHDGEGDALTYSYRWFRNGALLPGETGPTLDLSKPGTGDKGDQVSVEVTASDGRLSSAPATASVAVANSAPAVAVDLSTTTPTKKTVVTATAAASDPDGDALTYAYTWKLGGQTVRTTTTSSTTDAFDLGTVEVENGSTLTVTVEAGDGAASTSASASATVTRGR